MPWRAYAVAILRVGFAAPDNRASLVGPGGGRLGVPAVATTTTPAQHALQLIWKAQLILQHSESDTVLIQIVWGRSADVRRSRDGETSWPNRRPGTAAFRNRSRAQRMQERRCGRVRVRLLLMDRDVVGLSAVVFERRRRRVDLAVEYVQRLSWSPREWESASRSRSTPKPQPR